jgi:glycosyltransferase involved in cell wall biosynthesis
MLSHYFEERGGGIEIIAAAVAHELALRGLDVVWLAVGSGTRTDEAVRRIPLAASSAAERLLKIPYPILWPSAWVRIFREVGRCDVVLVHDALYMASVVAYLAARLQNKPYVVVQHVGFVPYRRSLLRGLMRAANRCIAMPILRRADRVIFYSALTMRYFAAVSWRRPPAFFPNGVDTAIFFPASASSEVDSTRRHLGLPVGMPLALFVGRFVEKKGLHVLEPMARVRTDVLFVFAGHGELDPRSWGLSNVRVYSGLSGSTLAALYRASDVLVLPSVGEGFPLVVQEALACALPVICGTDTASADPRASPYLRGVPVDLERPEETAGLFVAEMTRTLADPETPAQTRAGAEFARGAYSWATCGATYADILQELCPKGSSAQELSAP